MARSESGPEVVHYSAVDNIGDRWRAEEGADQCTIALDDAEIGVDLLLKCLAVSERTPRRSSPLHMTPHQLVRVQLLDLTGSDLA